MAEHTNGPWNYYNNSHGTRIYNRWRVGNKDRTICIVEPGDDKQMENARLIAAAPELLAALNGLFEHCAMVHKHWGEGSNARQADAAISEALAAITKATGTEAVLA